MHVTKLYLDPNNNEEIWEYLKIYEADVNGVEITNFLIEYS